MNIENINKAIEILEEEARILYIHCGIPYDKEKKSEWIMALELYDKIDFVLKELYEIKDKAQRIGE